MGHDAASGDPLGDVERSRGPGPASDVGAIAAGRFGDIVAVEGNPLENVRLLEHIPVVIKSGAIVIDRRGEAQAAQAR